MQQHPVPQDVTGFKFKLIGDMTVNQFVYLAAGVLLAYFLSRVIGNPIIRWPVCFTVFITGFAFAFLPYDDRPLERWTTNFVKAIYMPTMFLWKKSEDIPEMLSVAYSPIPQSNNKITGTSVSRETLDEYVKSLPSQEITPMDEQEKKLIQQIDEQMKQVFTGETHKFEISGDEKTLIDVQNRQFVDTTTIASSTSVNQPVISIHSPVTDSDMLIPAVGHITVHPLRKLPKEHPDELAIITTQKAQETVQAPVIEKPKEPEKIEQKPLTDNKNAAYHDVLEDITKIKDEPQTVHFDVRTKTQTEPVKPDDQNIPLPVLTDVEEKNQAVGLQKEIDRLQKDLQAKSHSANDADKKDADKLQEDLKILQSKLTDTLAEKQVLEEELMKSKKDARNKKTEDVVIPTETIKVEKNTVTTVKFVPSQMSAQIGVVQPTAPNLVTGIVKDQTGNILPNVLIEIKNKNDKTERALKTNKLGQFYTATPLDNGVYTVHFEDTRNLYQFDIIEITLDGNIFPPIEVKAKNPKDAEREKLRSALFGKQS